MKFYTLVALLASTTAQDAVPEEVIEVDPKIAIRENLVMYKAFYDGYYKAFYHAKTNDSILKACMDDDTIDNMVMLREIMYNPFALFEF
jgi:hypothetical protein